MTSASNLTGHVGTASRQITRPTLVFDPSTFSRSGWPIKPLIELPGRYGTPSVGCHTNPFSTGRSHPVENGFVWHPTLGVPYLPGSSIKGLIGQPDRENVLGSKTRVGRVICLDAVPTCPVRLEADVMTPHY